MNFRFLALLWEPGANAGTEQGDNREIHPALYLGQNILLG